MAIEKPNLVSILTLNRKSLTEKAVNSVMENSRSDVRIIFFDNGSTDDTLDYLASLKEQYPGTVDFLRSSQNIGVAAGRNKVFRHAISNYGANFGWILNLDNDCLVHPGYDEALTCCFEETGAYAVCPRLIQTDGRIFHNVADGFLINLGEMRLRLEYDDNVNISYDDPRVSERVQTDVLLGTSAKSPKFLTEVGFYDEGHKIGWEDFSLALRALGLTRDDFFKWRAERGESSNWIPLRTLMGDERSPSALAVYEPSCMITHDHPVTQEHQDYEKVRWKAETIQESTDHFETVWGVRPVM